MNTSGPTKPNRTGISTPNDVVMTPDSVANFIVDYFSPKGKSLDPARGDGAFYKHLPKPRYWCEIQEGRNFLEWERPVDWIITNPPFSIYDDFLLHSFKVSKNVVLLTTLLKTFKSQKIERAVQKYGGLKEVLMLGTGGKIGFPFGFQVGCLYYKKGYSGDIKLTRNYL